LRYVHLPEGSDDHSGSGMKAHWGERTVVHQGRDVLYLLTDAVVDTVCCGDRVFHYATVLGYVKEWQSEKDEHGLLVSLFEPIADSSTQREIEALLKQDDSELQVSFRSESD
jgi:hypothetical protein